MTIKFDHKMLILTYDNDANSRGHSQIAPHFNIVKCNKSCQIAAAASKIAKVTYYIKLSITCLIMRKMSRVFSTCNVCVCCSCISSWVFIVKSLLPLDRKLGGQIVGNNFVYNNTRRTVFLERGSKVGL